MADPWLMLAAGCALLGVDTALRVDDGRLIEATSVVVNNTADCHQFRIPIEPNVRVIHTAGRQKNSDGTSIPMEGMQFEQSDRGLDDRAVMVVHLPAIKVGDQAHVRLTRSWPLTPTWTWQAGMPTDRARLRLFDGLRTTQGARKLTYTQPTAAVHVAIATGTTAPNPPSTDFSNRQPPAKPVTLTQTLRLITPDGDPMVTLYPGAGSRVEVTEEFVFVRVGTARIPSTASSRSRSDRMVCNAQGRSDPGSTE